MYKVSIDNSIIILVNNIIIIECVQLMDMDGAKGEASPAILWQAQSLPQPDEKRRRPVDQ